MTVPKGEDLPRYEPVSPTGNGHKVRPDLQTKIVGLVIVAAFLGVMGYLAKTVVDVNERLTRLEAVVPVRLENIERETREGQRRLEEQIKELAAMLKPGAGGR